MIQPHLWRGGDRGRGKNNNGFVFLTNINLSISNFSGEEPTQKNSL
jgi:hypothetical protein